MNAPTTARDRMVAFAFCWADVLIKLDTSLRVLFDAGPTKALLGVGAEAKNFVQGLRKKSFLFGKPDTDP
jgi:hypothetical protein